MITGGTVKYGETRKMADFENRRADVELSFNVADSETDPQKIIANVAAMARQRCFEMFSNIVLTTPVLAPVDSNLIPGALTPSGVPGQYNMPAYQQIAEKLDQQEAENKTARVHSKRAPKMPVPIAVPTAFVADPAALEEPPALILTPTTAPVAASAVKEITDAEIMDATTKHQQQVKNAPAIRKLLTEMDLTVPPGRIIEIPQAKRQTYLDKLVQIKPLA